MDAQPVRRQSLVSVLASDHAGCRRGCNAGVGGVSITRGGGRFQSGWRAANRLHVIERRWLPAVEAEVKLESLWPVRSRELFASVFQSGVAFELLSKGFSKVTLAAIKSEMPISFEAILPTLECPIVFRKEKRAQLTIRN